MPYRKLQIINDEIYHVILRGNDGILIFKSLDDYFRGIFSIYEFNNEKSIEIRRRREERKKEKAGGDPLSVIDKRDKIVEIIAFCFMPNHIHLLLRQVKDGGISKFMMKFGAGYGGYFNKKYERKGHLFQNRFLPVHIGNNNQFMVVANYIHLNPLSLVEPDWKEAGIKDSEAAIRFVENYKWSSYMDYLGIKNFPSVTEREFLLKTIGGVDKIKDFAYNWIMYKKEFNNSQILFLE